jgi:hypothetical protein
MPSKHRPPYSRVLERLLLADNRAAVLARVRHVLARLDDAGNPREDEADEAQHKDADPAQRLHPQNTQ